MFSTPIHSVLGPERGSYIINTSRSFVLVDLTFLQAYYSLNDERTALIGASATLILYMNYF